MDQKKIKLSVLGFSFNQTQSGTYGLVLEEQGGVRRLMIVVGTPEAQSIAFKLQETVPPRPLTHDLFSALINAFDISLEEIFIYKYENGVFFSRLQIKQEDRVVFIDSRTSDAIGLALRTDADIYTSEDIMQELAVVFSEKPGLSELKRDDSDEDISSYEDYYSSFSAEELESMLDDAIEKEEYELASVLRDELDKRMTNN